MGVFKGFFERVVWRIEIQDYLIAAVQNIKVVIKDRRGDLESGVKALAVDAVRC
jgi:hypothetical protein